MLTIKDIKSLINKMGYCTHCIKRRENNFVCPFLLGDTNFCGLDCVIIAIDYIDRGEY